MSLALLLIVSARPRTSSIMILIVGLFSGVIPLVSIYALQDRSADFTYISVIAFVLSLLVTCLPRVRVPYVRLAPALFLWICTLSVLVVVGLLVGQGSYRHFTFDFYSVYEYRGELSDLAFVGPFRYFTDWAFNVFNITLLVWALYYHNRIVGLFAVASQIFMYGCILLKAILFNLPFVVLTYWIIRRRASIVGLGWLMSGIVLLGMLEVWLLSENDITALITRRVLAIPAYLANEYYEL